MPPFMPPHRTTDRATVEAFLDQDPVASAVAWYRCTEMEGAKEVYVDADPPHAVLGIVRPEWAEGGAGIALHSADPNAAQQVLEAWPRGPTFFHLSEEWMLSLVEPRIGAWDGGVFWLFELDPKDFRGEVRHEVRPLGPEWADLVAKVWDPEWDQAADYVRARIAAGHAYAVYVDGEPVAWAFLHLETPRVSLMGFLHVLEGHRGKGYARSVSSALAKDVLARGKIPALHVKTDNAPSLELTASLGFHRVRKQVWGESVGR
jgi:GNAT superfamily N-acetyltransferase